MRSPIAIIRSPSSAVSSPPDATRLIDVTLQQEHVPEIHEGNGDHALVARLDSESEALLCKPASDRVAFVLGHDPLERRSHRRFVPELTTDLEARLEQFAGGREIASGCSHSAPIWRTREPDTFVEPFEPCRGPACSELEAPSSRRAFEGDRQGSSSSTPQPARRTRRRMRGSRRRLRREAGFRRARAPCRASGARPPVRVGEERSQALEVLDRGSVGVGRLRRVAGTPR